MRGAKIGLALQGGGAYAAFTSGVLKALFNKRRKFLEPAAVHSISGTSGGALNAVLLGRALHEGCADPVKYVQRLWELNRVERLLKRRHSGLRLLTDESLATLVDLGRELQGAHLRVSEAARARIKAIAFDLIQEVIREAAPGLPQDITQALLPNEPPYVTVAATEVKTGQAHYFTNNDSMVRRSERFEIANRRQLIRELCLGGVYGSLAHPLAFPAVHLGDAMYWDGYYTCNPPFVHLFREGCDEVVLVRLIQQQREEVAETAPAVKDRIEEIIQNTTLNMEIFSYLEMRDMLGASKGRRGGKPKLALRGFNPAAVYHEIRLLKPGNIDDAGYPMNDFVETLTRLGRKAVEDKAGFIAAYRKADKGLQVISEVDFEREQVRSRVVDLDRFAVEEKGAAAAELSQPSGSRFLRFFKNLRRR